MCTALVVHVCMCTLHTTVLYTVDEGVQFTVYSETCSLGRFCILSIVVIQVSLCASVYK